MDDSGITEPSQMPTVEGTGERHSPPQEEAVNTNEAGPSHKLSRKRTKTGCLTCRRRRIKCGEERPTCANCIKSKRQCEGYNQRVIFKYPLNAYRGPFATPGTQPTFHTSSHSTILPNTRHDKFRQAAPPTQALLPNIRPKPSQEPQDHTARDVENSGWFREESRDMTSNATTEFNNHHNPVERQSHLIDPQNPDATPYHNRSRDTLSRYATTSQDPQTLETPRTSQIHYDFNAILEEGFVPQQNHPVEYLHDGLSLPHTSSATPSWSYKAVPGGSRSVEYHNLPQADLIDGEAASHLLPVSDGPEISSDDDFYDVSDEDMVEIDCNEEFESDSIQQDYFRKNDLGIVMALQASQDNQDLSIRTYHSFVDGYGPEMLANYHPSPHDSPLSDSTTARIFCHFINILGPSISMYERHPANASFMFHGHPLPRSQQHIWSYTMPTIALSDRSLLHAILALSSLHMAKLQNGPITASLKHYHIAIRRVAKSISLPMRRGQPTTLATTLLLGFYEVMSADHNKWSNHLLGARHLLKEIDFASIAKYLKLKKLRNRRLFHSSLNQNTEIFQILDNDVNEFRRDLDQPLQDDVDDVDENLISMIMGTKLKYDEYGQILDDGELTDGPNNIPRYTQRDLETYETQRDLFWWFAKQDAFQSILGGNRLFLDYDLWSHCPPRAPFGRRDAVYGTFDHLVLLIGRLADFSARDLKRKRRVMQTSGGQWQPPPGFPMPCPPSEHRNDKPPGQSGAPNIHKRNGSSQQGPPQANVPQMPQFPGMLPAVIKATLPRGFTPPREVSPLSDEENISVEDQTAAAKEEWLEIRSAFNILADQFGPDFQALGPEYTQPIITPFGPALQYRTYSIAGIWMAYYMGLIVCHRAHPSMPPAAMMAAGIAARQTASFANEIGRIAAGISPDVTNAENVNIGVGAGLMESAMSLFVAGVQLQEPTQRSWIIRRLLDIERLTGWQTASQCAKGCELSWIKAAQNGMGPPYARSTFNETVSVGKIWQSAGKRIESMLLETAAEDTVVVAKTTRVRHAMGILGIEDHLDDLDLGDDRVSSR